MLAGNDEPETLRFFLSTCCGEYTDAWKVGVSEPGGLQEEKVLEIAQQSRSLAIDIFELCSVDVDNPIGFLQRNLYWECRAELDDKSEGDSEQWHRDFMKRLSDLEKLWDLPAMLHQFADGIKGWWNFRGKRTRKGAVHRDYLQAHFHAYGAVVMGKFTYPDMAKLLELSRYALKSNIAPNDDSVKTIVSGYKRTNHSQYEGMMESVRRYLEMKKTALAEGREWKTTYIRAANYVKGALPILTVAAPLSPDRRKQRGKTRP